jgi:hypothetical protein
MSSRPSACAALSISLGLPAAVKRLELLTQMVPQATTVAYLNR